MAGVRRRFGRLLGATLGLALLVLGSWPFWGIAGEQWQAWGYARRLRDPTPGARAAAAAGLVQLGGPAAPWVIRAIGDPDPSVRREACAILLRVDLDRPARAVATLATALGDPDPSVRGTVAGQLGSAGGTLIGRAGAEAGGRAVAALGAGLRDPAADVRRAAAYALTQIGPAARAARGDLDAALAGPDRDLGVSAAWGLLRVDHDAARPRVVAALVAMLDDPGLVMERWRAVQLLLAEVGEDELAAVLVPLLRHPDAMIRQDSLGSLVARCPRAAVTRPALIAALDDPDGGLRCSAALHFLGQGGPLVPRALDVLAEQLVAPRDGGLMIEDVIKNCREVAPGSPGELVARLVAFRGEGPKTSFLTIHALRVIGPPAALPAASLLRGLLDAPDEAVRAQAAEALAELDDPAALAALPRLVASAGPGREVGIRLTALDAIGKLGPAAAGAASTLVGLVDEEDVAISAAALAALGRVDPPRAAELKRAILGRP